MLSLINPYGISNGLTPIPFLLKKTLSEKNSMSIRPSAVFKTYVGIEPYCLSSPIKTAIFFSLEHIYNCLYIMICMFF